MHLTYIEAAQPRIDAIPQVGHRCLDRLKVKLPKFDAPVALMSGDQRQAIAVARATVFARKVVMLDEPIAALGLRESRKVFDLIIEAPEGSGLAEGKTWRRAVAV